MTHCVWLNFGRFLVWHVVTLVCPGQVYTLTREKTTWQLNYHVVVEVVHPQDRMSVYVNLFVYFGKEQWLIAAKNPYGWLAEEQTFLNCCRALTIGLPMSFWGRSFNSNERKAESRSFQDTPYFISKFRTNFLTAILPQKNPVKSFKQELV